MLLRVQRMKVLVMQNKLILLFVLLEKVIANLYYNPNVAKVVVEYAGFTILAGLARSMNMLVAKEASYCNIYINPLLSRN